MLMDYFLRASGIFCRENQPAADLIIPIDYLHESRHVESRNIGAFLIQLKLKQDTLDATEKTKIRNGLSHMAAKLAPPDSQVTRASSEAGINDARPSRFVGICLSLNSDGKKSLNARIDSIDPVGAVDSIPFVFARYIKPTDVLGEETHLADAFHRLVYTSSDPAS